MFVVFLFCRLTRFFSCYSCSHCRAEKSLILNDFFLSLTALARYLMSFLTHAEVLCACVYLRD